MQKLTETLKAMALLGLAALSAASARAEVIDTTDGAITVTPGVCCIGEVGEYLRGGDGLVGIAGSYPDGPAPAVAASNIDHYWLQGDPEIVWSFSSKWNSVIAVAGVDHGPVPQENLEFIMWGSNDLLTWEEGKIKAIYRDGVDPAAGAVGESDDYSSLWVFSQGYKYVKATSGDHLIPSFGSVGEFEIDGVARPCPDGGASALLLGFGFGALGLLRRKVS